jgi:hypothetical protein
LHVIVWSDDARGAALEAVATTRACARVRMTVSVVAAVGADEVERRARAALLSLSDQSIAESV